MEINSTMAELAEPIRNPVNTVPIYYRDAPAVMEWLCKAFGFKEQLVVYNPDGSIDHAQLTFGPRMILLASAPQDDFSAEHGEDVIHAAHFLVDDTDAHYAQAKAAGAEIVFDDHDEQHGRRGYACRDPEGHLWNFDSCSER